MLKLLPWTWCLQVCKYIDMPLQHINNLTLLAMNRPPQAHTKALLRKLRDNIPGLALRTTFISGGQQAGVRGVA
jgi:ribosomal protein S12 methylthiotransferase